jgi:hypothetical protein
MRQATGRLPVDRAVRSHYESLLVTDKTRKPFQTKTSCSMILKGGPDLSLELSSGDLLNTVNEPKILENPSAQKQMLIETDSEAEDASMEFGITDHFDVPMRTYSV